MSVPDEVDLSGGRKQVYRFVERHGPVEPSVVAESIGVDPESFQHHVSILKRDDLLEEDAEGRLRPSLQRGETEEFEEAGVVYEIRPARTADFSGVLGVIRAVTEGLSYVTAETVAEELAYEETLVRRTPTECRVVFVATVADEVVGWAHVEAQEQVSLRGTAECTVGVLEEYRRHGIGSHLLQRGVQWAASRGCRKVYNSHPATNDAAIDFLERNGWEIETIREDHYEIDGELVDEVMLARTLDN